MRKSFHIVRGVALLAALLVASIVVAPAPTTTEAYLWCSGVQGEQRFENMQECWRAKAGAGCGCATDPNPWSWRFWRAVPLVLGAVGFWLFRATPLLGAALVPATLILTAVIYTIASSALQKIDGVQTLNDLVAGVTLGFFSAGVYGLLVLLQYGVRRARRAA